MSVVDELKKQWGILFSKAVQNFAEGKTKCERDFRKKYKYAKLNKFEFDVDLDPSNAEVSKYIVRYKVPDSDGTDGYSSYDITSDTFKNNPEYRKDLFWKEFWEDTGTVQDFEKNTGKLRNYGYYVSNNNQGWYVYVSNNKNFWRWFPNPEITLPLEESPTKNSYKENKYLASLYAAYITTYLCGISTKHFQTSGDVPRMVTSIMKYHLYFHMSRFLKYPELMDRFITSDVTKIIENNRPKKLILSDVKFDDAGANLEVWKKTRPSTIKNKLYNVHYAKNTDGNIVGINYQLILRYEPKDVKNDWKVFVATKTNGFTDTGVELLEQTVLSFVYAVLGAQADLRKPIVGDDVKGEADVVKKKFVDLTKELIVQKDSSKYIGLFRTAVASTKSRLNLAICPGVSLIPSKLVILDFTIPGYNNILKGVDTKTMVFGKNNRVNPTQISVSANAVDTTLKTPTVRVTPQSNNPNTVKLQEKKPETELTKTTTTAVATKGTTAVAKYVPPHDKQVLYAGVSMLTIGVMVAKFII